MLNLTHPAARLLTIVLSVGAVLHGQSSAAASADSASERIQQQIGKLGEEWSAAFVRADIPALEKILADDFVLTDWRGRVTNKADEIANAREGGLLSNTVRDLVIRVYGNTAIVVGKLTLVIDSKPNQPLHLRITDVWILRGARWQIVAGHISASSDK